MEGTEDIYVNDELAPKKRVKKKEVPAGAQRFRKEDDPDYENISVITWKRNGALEQQSMPIHWAPAASAPSSSSGRCLVHRPVLCLYLLLALSFLLGISLLSLVVVKSSDFSEQLRSVKSELWNVSSILQKEQENTEQLEIKIIKIKAISDACDAMVKQVSKDLSSKREILNILNAKVEKLEKAQKSGPNPTHSTG
ncbi:mast cell-expressed membrane protein 1-like [Phascolarctos cinereus]|uniref:Mast cell-expressed membrane protein 1-like n=1 Tax=Phascolarctos cinereus TaxID=38626 RepID=A0A6P5JR79_PHACI|nr:mast cell-expressed membrane protein 1-like [Phascolarctos cinereus]XP_020835536.1 mast cell-expressed membrane protein 1-like [Phascolarctos cinereus]